ncbi:MAG: DMT family transporter [Planctomycetota bacterium]|nr:DMT family transporter [Planctomycetota bacterium]
MIGEFAAIGAASCWVVTAMAFTEAGRRVGATVVNVTRLWIALVILLLVHAALFGSWWPDVPTVSWWYLGLSGVIGLALGDQFLFRALVDAGPRISTLMMTVAPALTAVIAWPVLDQPLGWLAMLGIMVTLGGIAWVVCERRADDDGRGYPHPARGVFLGFLGGIGQAVGLILAKLGMEGVGGETIDPWTATLVRMILGTLSATLLMAALLGARRIDRGTGEPSRSRGIGLVSTLILVGAVFGPVLGVWLSLVSIDRIDAGIAATLMSLSPIFILPVAKLIEDEAISRRAVLGAVIAVVGVAMLFLAGGGASDEAGPQTSRPDRSPPSSTSTG